MRSYCRLKTGLAVVLLIYMVMASIGLLFSPNKEIFPFYSWFLFSAVPNPGSHYEVFILKNVDNTFDPPLPYNKAPGIAVSPGSIVAYQFIQKLGRTFDSGNMPDFKDMNLLFQRNFLSGNTVYQLVRVQYDPVERWHGKEPGVQALQTFQYSTSSP